MSFASSAYSITASYFHWFAAVPMIGCVGTVLKAQQSPKEDKPKLMNLHKSLGLLTGMIVAPRLAYRIFNRVAVRRRKRVKQTRTWLSKNEMLKLVHFVPSPTWHSAVSYTSPPPSISACLSNTVQSGGFAGIFSNGTCIGQPIPRRSVSGVSDIVILDPLC